MTFRLAALSVFLLTAGYGCYYDNVEELYPNGCNTTDVSYSQTIRTLLLNYECLGCHAGSSPDAGVDLDGYENVKFYVDNGQLMGSILPEEGYELMPLGGPRMKQCDIDKIQSWINAGAPDN